MLERAKTQPRPCHVRTPRVAVEPRMVMDHHWGRAYNHLCRDHALLDLGVDVNTAIEFTATGARDYVEGDALLP